MGEQLTYLKLKVVVTALQKGVCQIFIHLNPLPQSRTGLHLVLLTALCSWHAYG